MLRRLSPLSADGSHRRLDHGKGSGTDGHSTQQRRPNALPEATHALTPPRLREAITHALVAHVLPEPVRLHLALDDIKRVAGQPEGLAGKPTVQRHLVSGDLAAREPVARRVGVHHPLEGQEPHAVGLGLADDGDGLAAIHAAEDAAAPGAELAHAVQRPGVQTCGAVGLRLETDAHMLDRARNDRVGDARERAGRVVLPITQVLDGPGCVGRLEVPLRVAEGAELDRHARADAQERRQRALVEGQRALFRVDGGRGVEGRAILCRCLQTHFDDVEGLTCGGNVSSICFR